MSATPTDTTGTATPTDPVLAAERAHLGLAGDCLTEMRAAASAVVDAGVDAWASERLGAARAERLRSLAADPGVPPFFGRTDTATETFHIGRRHVRDDAGDLVAEGDLVALQEQWVELALDEVDVGQADTGGAHLDEDLAGAGRRARHLLHLELLGAHVEPAGEHRVGHGPILPTGPRLHTGAPVDGGDARHVPA